MNKFQLMLLRFMSGRNGVDFFNMILFIMIIILDILAMITGFYPVVLLSLIVSFYFMYRFLSKNLTARQAENQMFSGMVKMLKLRFDNRGKYRYFKCKGCKKTIRVPKGKGRIEVTCPVCGNKTIHKT